MRAKSARLAAPIALAAAAVGIYLIVHAGLSSHRATASQSSQLPPGSRGHRPAAHTPKFYVVKGGDTLSGISIKTHVSILRITDLNPGLSPNSLQTGQRLRLRR
ncbi:MAG: LysM peptidoglycan-binding domain-containing protein [Actinomycetota bacterium]|nr:LysM peptidoglycan-binding domain-containing protein [Actinomycetota bacterium]